MFINKKKIYIHTIVVSTIRQRVKISILIPMKIFNVVPNKNDFKVKWKVRIFKLKFIFH